jgi:hypothetical protein
MRLGRTLDTSLEPDTIPSSSRITMSAVPAVGEFGRCPHGAQVMVSQENKSNGGRTRELVQFDVIWLD